MIGGAVSGTAFHHRSPSADYAVDVTSDTVGETMTRAPLLPPARVHAWAVQWSGCAALVGLVAVVVGVIAYRVYDAGEDVWGVPAIFVALVIAAVAANALIVVRLAVRRAWVLRVVAQGREPWARWSGRVERCDRAGVYGPSSTCYRLDLDGPVRGLLAQTMEQHDRRTRAGDVVSLQLHALNRRIVGLVRNERTRQVVPVTVLTPRQDQGLRSAIKADATDPFDPGGWAAG